KCPPGVLSWAGSTRGLPTLARAFVQHPSASVRIRSKLAGTGQEVQRIHGEVVWVPGGNDLPCACEFYTHEARLPQPLPRTKSSPSRSTRAALGLHLAPLLRHTPSIRLARDAEQQIRTKSLFGARSRSGGHYQIVITRCPHRNHRHDHRTTRPSPRLPVAGG